MMCGYMYTSKKKKSSKPRTLRRRRRRFNPPKGDRSKGKKETEALRGRGHIQTMRDYALSSLNDPWIFTNY